MDNSQLERQAKQSGYRMKIASLAAPADERMRKRNAFASELCESFLSMKKADRGIILDVDPFLASFGRFMQTCAKGRGDPLLDELVTLAERPDNALTDKWFRICSRHGYAFFINDCAGHYGSVIRTIENGLFTAHLFALTHNGSVDNSVIQKDGSCVLLDTANALEDAVFSINAYRYARLEPISSMLLNNQEYGKPNAEEIYRRRLKVVSADPKDVDRAKVSKVLDLLASSDYNVGKQMASMRMLTARYGSLSTKPSEPDEVCHTMRFLNSKVSTSLAVYAFISMKKELIPEEDALVLGTLAGMAFGNVFDKFGGVYSQAFTGELTQTTLQMVFELVRTLGYRPGGGPVGQTIFAFTRSEQEYRGAALSVLQSRLDRLGARLSDPEIVKLAGIGRTPLLSMQDLPKIAAAWKAQYPEGAGGF